MPDRVLITGGCGFIGINLVYRLLKEPGCMVRILDNESLGKREYLREFPEVEFIHGDVRSPETLAEALKGIDGVIHLAADTRVMDSIADPVHNFENNVLGSFYLLQAMRQSGASSIINASTGGAILGEVAPPVHEGMAPEPASPYGASKLAVEGYLHAYSQSYGFKAVSLRFSNVYGQRSWHKGSVVAHFFKNILAGNPLTIYGDGSQKRDFIHVDDICRGIILALQKGVSGSFQLGTGEPTSINQLISLMKEVLGDRVPVKTRYEDFRPGEIRHTWCDITKAKDILTFQPRISLRKGLCQTWEWFSNVKPMTHE